jgi:hypothetical protein
VHNPWIVKPKCTLFASGLYFLSSGSLLLPFPPMAILTPQLIEKSHTFMRASKYILKWQIRMEIIEAFLSHASY